MSLPRLDENRRLDAARRSSIARNLIISALEIIPRERALRDEARVILHFILSTYITDFELQPPYTAADERRIRSLFDTIRDEVMGKFDFEEP